MGLVAIESKTVGDLDIFVQASADLLGGKNIYTEQYHEYYHYYYDVLFALIISPLQFLTPYWAAFIWLCINMILTYRLWKLITSYIPFENISAKAKKAITWFSCIMLFAVWHKNIHLAQMTIFILWLSMEGLYQIDRKKFLLGALLIALGITIKILPLLLIPYLIYRGKFRSTAYIVAWVIILLNLPALFIGFEYNNFLLAERWALVSPENAEHVRDEGIAFHSISTFLAALLVENPWNTPTLELKRNIANVSAETLGIIVTAVRLFFVLLTLHFLRSWPFKPAKNKLKTLYEVSYIFLITPLLFPHQQHYAFFFAAPAVVYLFYYYCIRFKNDQKPLPNGKKIILISLAVIVFFLLSSNFILGQWRDIYNHYKTLTYGIFIIVAILFAARPNKLQS